MNKVKLLLGTFPYLRSSNNRRNGQVSLTDEELAKLNRLIKEAGFEEQLEADHEPKIVVGYVKHASHILILTIYRLLRQK